MSRKRKLYRAIVALNGRVPGQAEWRAIGWACGYTAWHDLAGFFGGRRPSMVLLADGSRELTSDGWSRAHRS